MKISTLYKRHIRIVPGIKSYVLATAFVFILGMVITTLSWYVDRERLNDQKTSQMNEQAVTLQADITNRLRIYEQILRGASGLSHASEEITAADWRRYIQQYDLQETYPGINAVGYIKYLPAPALPSYVDTVRTSSNPTFTVYPEGARADYAPITYIEPLSEASKRTLGFDVFTDSLRSSITAKARDSGNVVLSEKLTLLSDRGTNNNEASFNMYMAVYKKDTKPNTIEERRAALDGFVLSGYRANNFFNKVINKENFTAYRDVRIFDGQTTSKDALLYQSTNFASFDQKDLSPVFNAKIFDRDWSIQFGGPVDTSDEDQQSSNMILIGGATISFAIAGFLFLVMLTRARAIVYSKQNETQQAKDDLLSLASHQLRTPATAVKQYLGMILEGYTGEVNDKQLSALQKAYASNERQLDTINQILYVAKADAGRLSIVRNNFDLNLLVDDIALDLADTLETNNQSILIERSRKKLKINADESSIRMVVENLISNAGKYSYEGSQVTIRTGTRDDEVFVAITDQGVGIAPEDYDKLFKKFSRIDNDLSLQVGGSGIGLYIDKVLIELHGGRIVVDSSPGAGSTFTIFLPKNSANNLTEGSNNNAIV